MSTLAATVSLDVRMQARSKLYSIGITVAALLGLMGRFAFGTENAGVVGACFFLLGTGGTTYFFAAALVIMEKSEGTLAALRVTPLTSRAYILSKVLTLVSFATVEGLVVWLVGFYGRGVDVAPAPLFGGLVLLSVFQTLVGLGQVAPYRSITAFLMPGAVIVGGVLQTPFLYALGIGPEAVWHLIPSQAPFTIMLAGGRTLASWQWAYGLGVSVVSIVVAGWWALRRFDQHIGLQRS